MYKITAEEVGRIRLTFRQSDVDETELASARKQVSRGESLEFYEGFLSGVMMSAEFLRAMGASAVLYRPLMVIMGVTIEVMDDTYPPDRQ